MRITLLLAMVSFLGGMPALAQDKPSNPDLKRVKELEDELAKVTKEMEQKEGEAKALRAKVVSLRGELAKLKPSEHVYINISELVKGMPKDLHPTSPENQVQLDRANDWMKENLAGRYVEVEAIFLSADLKRQPDKTYKGDIEVARGSVVRADFVQHKIILGENKWKLDAEMKVNFDSLTADHAERYSAYSAPKIIMGDFIQSYTPLTLRAQLKGISLYKDGTFVMQLSDPSISDRTGKK